MKDQDQAAADSGGAAEKHCRGYLTLYPAVTKTRQDQTKNEHQPLAFASPSNSYHCKPRRDHPAAMPRPSQPVGSLDRITRYRIWKEQHVPILYDWLSSRKLVWPHGAIRWGALSTDDPTRSRDRPLSSQNFTTRALYLAERTGASTRDPNTLLHFDARVVQELTNKPNDVAKPWLDEAVIPERLDQISTRDFWLRKRIIHPGEVNRIRLVSPDVVVTHTDSPSLFIWDFKQQPDRKKDELVPNTPTCTLVGHKTNAEYALDIAHANGSSDKSSDTWIVSGGTDCLVLLWRLADYESTGQKIQNFISFEGGHGVLSHNGHSATVEDVSFNSADRNLVVSVGQDSCMLLWDIRRPARPITDVTKAHQGDVNCCDFAGIDGYRIATGGSDALIRIWDRRFLKNPRGEKKPIRTLQGHTNQVTNVMWNEYVPNLFASAGEDGQVLIWDTTKIDRRPATPDNMSPASHELVFRHVGHTLSEGKIVDFEWHPSESDPYCIASLSETEEGGSTMQMWRISDLIYRPENEIVTELRQYARSKVLQ